MAKKDDLTKDAYDRQIAGLNPWPKSKKKFDETLSVAVYSKQKQALKSIPNWTNKLREAIDRLIKEELGSAD